MTEQTETEKRSGVDFVAAQKILDKRRAEMTESERLLEEKRKKKAEVVAFLVNLFPSLRKYLRVSMSYISKIYKYWLIWLYPDMVDDEGNFPTHYTGSSLDVELIESALHLILKQRYFQISDKDYKEAERILWDLEADISARKKHGSSFDLLMHKGDYSSI